MTVPKERFSGEEELRWAAERLRQLRRHVRINPPKPVGHILQRLLARRGYGQALATADLRQAWREVVGERLGAVTAVGSLKDGVLTVWASDSSVLQELAFYKMELLEKIKERVASTAVRELRFRVGVLADGSR